jgi:small-conductance mechanosensitive channel
MTQENRTAKDHEPPSDPQELREEIRETREELGQTVEALAQKADVKAQVQEKVEERKEQLRGAQEQAKEKAAVVGKQAQERRGQLTTVAAVLAGALVLLWLIRRD